MGRPSKRQTLQNEGLAHARQLSSRRKTVKNQPLVDKENIFLPLLHIKFGLMKNFVKTMNKYWQGF